VLRDLVIFHCARLRKCGNLPTKFNALMGTGNYSATSNNMKYC